MNAILPRHSRFSLFTFLSKAAALPCVGALNSNNQHSIISAFLIATFFATWCLFSDTD